MVAKTTTIPCEMGWRVLPEIFAYFIHVYRHWYVYIYIDIDICIWTDIAHVCPPCLIFHWDLRCSWCSPPRRSQQDASHPPSGWRGREVDLRRLWQDPWAGRVPKRPVSEALWWINGWYQNSVFCIINHPFWGCTHLRKPPRNTKRWLKKMRSHQNGLF